MSPSDTLRSKGWRMFGGNARFKLWDHPKHQPDNNRGGFTTADAFEHETQYGEYMDCDCIKEAV